MGGILPCPCSARMYILKSTRPSSNKDLAGAWIGKDGKILRLRPANGKKFQNFPNFFSLDMFPDNHSAALKFVCLFNLYTPST